MVTTDSVLERWTGRSTPGAAYVHFDRERVLHERYTGLADVGSGRPVDARTSFHGFSVTKTMTAVAIVQLAQAGRIDLGELVRTYLPSMPYTGDIRVRHLLTHTAGLPNPLPLAWVHAPDAAFDGRTFFDAIFIRHPRTRWAPGERFAYSNLGYVLLGRLLEAITGRTYADHITEAILQPAGITPTELTFTHPPTTVHAPGT
ncbi:MAG: beta-lactamase family protein [Flavobacteriales bacterium]|nr:beta-lactamase family protein [Flavobacteriales bacterium]